MKNKKNKIADVCLILEGTYPFVLGGVSSWVHDLILNQSHLTFHLLALSAPNSERKFVYDVPDNVLSLTVIELQKVKSGAFSLNKKKSKYLFENLEIHLTDLLLEDAIEMKTLQGIIDVFYKFQGKLGREILLDSEESWNMLLRMYNSTMSDTSFIDYFWSWRTLFGGLYSILLGEYPQAKCYHSLCTGYAGLFLARINLETEKKCLLTEHGIYTNERRIEIASADWLNDQKAFSLSVNKSKKEKELRDFWTDTFSGYSLLCYQCCEYIATLYGGNKSLQIEEGADPAKCKVIANGIDLERFFKIKRERRVPQTIALIGRVVPIKDVKTYIRAVSALRKIIPDIQALILGPFNEDEDYHEECLELVRLENLSKNLTFTGSVNIDDYMPFIDVIVLTSVSEAQPLVILEAGATGIPSVATDVGACREMIYGRSDEEPHLGAGGRITHLSSPADTANALAELLLNPDIYESCSKAIKERVIKYYNKKDQHLAYKKLYDGLIN